MTDVGYEPSLSIETINIEAQGVEAITDDDIDQLLRETVIPEGCLDNFNEESEDNNRLILKYLSEDKDTKRTSGEELKQEKQQYEQLNLD